MVKVNTDGVLMHGEILWPRTVWSSTHPQPAEEIATKAFTTTLSSTIPTCDLSLSHQLVYERQECGMRPETVHVEWTWRDITSNLLSCYGGTGGKMDQTEWTVHNGGGSSGERLMCLGKTKFISSDIEIGGEGSTVPIIVDLGYQVDCGGLHITKNIVI